MKETLLLLLLMITANVGNSQIQNPVKWNYSAKKINPTTYELHLTANMGGNWHIYSQTTPDGGPVPTSIAFNKNPLITIPGKPAEVGKLQQKHEPLFGVNVKQFGGKVDFVQIVKLKAPVKTNVAGSIEFMVCDDTQCLPPTVQKFSIALK